MEGIKAWFDISTHLLCLTCDLQLFALKNFFSAVKPNEFLSREEIIRAKIFHEQSTKTP